MSEEADQQHLEQVRSLVAQALRSLGCALTLSVEGTWLRLGVGANAPRADVQGTVAQWETLPDDLRQRRATQIAELLAGGPSAPQLAVPRRARRVAPGGNGGPVIAPALVVLLTLAAVGLAYVLLGPANVASSLAGSTLFRPKSTPVGGGSQAADPDQERTQLARAACNQTRARVARGANVGPSDVEGWQVELVLVRRAAPFQLAAEPALTQFFAPRADNRASTLIWPRAKSLLAAQRFDATASVRPLPPLGAAESSALSVVFSGPYVAPYFSEAARGDYLLLADALAEALHASEGALYARCTDSDPHAIGSWFLGANPGAAVGSLVFFMAASNELPILNPQILGSAESPNSRSHAFDAIQRAAARLDRATTATLIGRELGMISGRPNQPSRLTFPFRDANRAARASFDAARLLDLTAH